MNGSSSSFQNPLQTLRGEGAYKSISSTRLTSAPTAQNGSKPNPNLSPAACPNGTPLIPTLRLVMAGLVPAIHVFE